jgi:glycosyl transferase family 87
MTVKSRSLSDYAAYLIIGVALLIAILACITFTEQVPQPLIDSKTLAIDWQAIHGALLNGHIKYEGGIVLMNPPWTAVLVLPLGFLPMRVSWGLVVFLTLAVELVSVPRFQHRWRYYAAIFLLVFSFPSLRQLADGNFESLVIAGVCLCLLGYQKQNPLIVIVGVLLATAKVQIVALFLAALGLYMLQTWKPALWLKAVGGVLMVVIPSMIWLGSEWLHNVSINPTFGSLIDISLVAAFKRAQLPLGVYLILWIALFAISGYMVWKSDRTFSREKAGMLVAASLLLAPYSAGNSVLSLLAIGAIPLFLKRPLLGLAVVILPDFGIFFGSANAAYFSTVIVLIMWGVLTCHTSREKISSATSEEFRNLSPPSGFL